MGLNFFLIKIVKDFFTNIQSVEACSVSSSGTGSSADLGVSSKYSNERFED